MGGERLCILLPRPSLDLDRAEEMYLLRFTLPRQKSRCMNISLLAGECL